MPARVGYPGHLEGQNRCKGSNLSSGSFAGGSMLVGMGRSLAGAVWRKFVLRFLVDRKSTRLNSSHTVISYAVFCDLQDLHSFPTRRSSDLLKILKTDVTGCRLELATPDILRGKTGAKEATFHRVRSLAGAC